MANIWTDENGKNVIITPFITKIYSDNLSIELDHKYNIYKPPKSIEKLGKTEWETAANSLTELYYLLRKTAGINTEELNTIGTEFSTNCRFGRSWNYASLKEINLLRSKKVKGIEVFFPTEELIKRSFEARK